jgi:hypothetical protein
VPGVCHQESHHSASIEVVDQLKGLYPHLPAVLRVAHPRAAESHHRPQRDVRWQVAECADAGAVGLFERKDGEAAFVAEVHRYQGANHIRRRAGHESWQRHRHRLGARRHDPARIVGGDRAV